jgi:predicted helicase
MSPTTSNNGFVFPLYIYNLLDTKKDKQTIIEVVDPSHSKDRIENFSPAFRKFIDKKYGHHYSPEEIMGYIYAALHSPTYRSKYAEFLKRDFPRIPFVDAREPFEKLSKLGWALMQTHLLKDIPSEPKIEVSKNDDPIEKPVYDPKGQRLYANKNLYFAQVPEDVWKFHIGGYQVLDRYLKYRKGRKLSLDEKENIINIVKVLRFTIDQMIKIDEIWKP